MDPTQPQAPSTYDPVPQATPDEPVPRPPTDEDTAKLSEVIIQARPDGTQIIPESLRLATTSPGWFNRLCSCFRYRPSRGRRSSILNPENAMLPPQSHEQRGRPTLVLDLDETLVHSSFKPLPAPDFLIPLELDNKVVIINVQKRPKVDEFLLKVGEVFEVVIFTASMKKYADPLIDKLDIHSVISRRLYRENCTLLSGGYVKDLSKLGRKLTKTILVDVRNIQNSPWCYQLQPSNALDIDSWYDDRMDTALDSLLPILEALAKVEDVTKVLPEIRMRRRKQAEEILDTAKTGQDDVPVAKRLPQSPSTHRGYYNSPRATGTNAEFPDCD